LPDGPKAVERHTPMIGDVAARARAEAENALNYFAISMGLFIVVVLAAAISSFRPLAIAAYLCLIPVFVSIVIRFWRRHRYRRLVSAALGVQIGHFLDVPLIPQKYEEWCAKHHITPYSPGTPPHDP
jgi:hypothetical protein